MKCKLCGNKLVKNEDKFCHECKRFLKWKYKNKLEERLMHDNNKSPEVKK